MARRGLVLLLLLSCLSPLFSGISQKDRQFLEMIAERTFRYFWEEANPDNGLIADATKNRSCSISVTGFGLAAACIADSRGWISRKEAYERVLLTLRSFITNRGAAGKTTVQAERGHHYHWVDMDTGEWSGQEGIFPTDTAAFMAGVLTAGEYFRGTEAALLADQIFRQVDWTWFLNRANNRIYVGWTPAGGHYGEFTKTVVNTLFLLLGISSPVHPLPVETWYSLGNSYFRAGYGGFSYVGDGAAYMHQWPFCFIDPRLKRDYFLDYSQNLRDFALASRKWCLDHREEGYGKEAWGLTPCVGPDKYGEYAAPVIPGADLPYNGKDNDGTVAPTAALGFMPFTPDESLAFARFLFGKHKAKVFGEYGFYDSFNLKKDFWCDEYLGIDQGPILIMIDNYLYGTVWKSFMRNRHIRQGLKSIGFTGLIDDFEKRTSKEPLSQWRSSSGTVLTGRDPVFYKQGEASLRIELKKNVSGSTLFCAPLLKDLSPYSCLAFWKSGASGMEVEIENFKRQRTALKKGPSFKDGAWELCQYFLPENRGEAAPVSRLLFHFTRHASSTQHLDHIRVSEEAVLKEPKAPSLFRARPGVMRGEAELFWQLPPLEEEEGRLASYSVRISGSPMKNTDDFNRAEDAFKDYVPVITRRTQRMAVGNLAPGKRYYFGMAVKNHWGLFSQPVFIDAVASSVPELFFKFKNKELVDFGLSEWEGFSSDGDEAKLKKVKAREGQGLMVSYRFKTEADWHWAGARKKIRGKLPVPCRFSFYLKGEGVDPNIEFKLIDRNNSVFGKKIDDFDFNGSWEKVVISSSELSYWWGGSGDRNMAAVELFELAFSSDEAGDGYVVINALAMEH